MLSSSSKIILKAVTTPSQFYLATQKPLTYYYSLLGLKPGFKPQQLKAAYLDLVKKYHPDLSKQPNAVQKFQEIQKAYDVLQDASAIKREEQEDKQSRRQTQKGVKYDDLSPDSRAAQDFQRRFRKEFKNTYPDQSMRFSYDLFKKHYENYQIKKKQWKLYAGQMNQEIWARKDEIGEEFPWKSLAGAGAIMGLLIGCVAFMNIK